MLPTIDILALEIQEATYHDRTYRITHGDYEDRINGHAEEIKALQQAIYLMLSTERYEHIIYSWDYGVELVDLFGKPMSYVKAELPRRIRDTLTQDDRIENVIDFEFEVSKNKLHTTFVVVSIYGNLNEELEVTI